MKKLIHIDVDGKPVLNDRGTPMFSTISASQLADWRQKDWNRRVAQVESETGTFLAAARAAAERSSTTVELVFIGEDEAVAEIAAKIGLRNYKLEDVAEP